MLDIRQRVARGGDWPFIKGLILEDPELQHDPDRFPAPSDFVVLTIKGEIRGCCALKVYGTKLGEIRSFTFKRGDWTRKVYAETLVRLCIRHAEDASIYQVFATIGKMEQSLFRRLGFRRLVGQKHAMLMSIKNREHFELKDMPGVKFVRARTQFHWDGIARLAKQNKRTVIQPGTKLFPAKGDFLIAVADHKVVGCTALTRFRDKRGKRCDIAEIRTVVVDRQYKGRGIGPQLVLRCANWAIDLGLVELFTVTGQKDWFTKLGFSTQRGSEEAWFMKLGKNGG